MVLFHAYLSERIVAGLSGSVYKSADALDLGIGRERPHHI